MLLKNVCKKARANKNAKTLKIGDVVKIVDCWEAELYTDKTFTVDSYPLEMGGTYHVWINGIGYFDVAYLEVVA